MGGTIVFLVKRDGKWKKYVKIEFSGFDTDYFLHKILESVRIKI